jgi:hypothetical protein
MANVTDITSTSSRNASAIEPAMSERLKLEVDDTAHDVVAEGGLIPINTEMNRRREKPSRVGGEFERSSLVGLGSVGQAPIEQNVRIDVTRQTRAIENLVAQATLQARLRFLQKDAKLAFTSKSGITYQFDSDALERLLEELCTCAGTVAIGGHDIPLGVFDDGVNSFAELDEKRVENGMAPLFSVAN